MADFRSSTLVQITQSRSTRSPVVCVTICHNEIAIISQFMNHYRSLGISTFYIVDDRSTDGTLQYLKDQADVSLFAPAEGREFKDHVGVWRQEILDHYSADQWATLPDIDEFLYYKEMPAQLVEVAQCLDRQHDEVLLAAMVDMYSDRPIAEQKFDGRNRLQDEFPFFDGQGVPPDGLRISAQPAAFLRRFPTPQVAIMGGVRERLFFRERELSPLQRWLMSRFAHIKRPLSPNTLERIQNKVVRFATKGCFSSDPFVLNKFALIKWRRGLKFSRAPHSVNQEMRVSDGLAAFLHFKFYKGLSGLEYNVVRGQHAGGSLYYRSLIERGGALKLSPICGATRRFEGVESLNDILR